MGDERTKKDPESKRKPQDKRDSDGQRLTEIPEPGKPTTRFG